MRIRKIYLLYLLQLFFIGLLALVLLGYQMSSQKKDFFENEMFSPYVRGLQMSSGELSEEVHFGIPKVDDTDFMLYRYLSYGQSEIVRGIYGTKDVFDFGKHVSRGRFFTSKDYSDASPTAVLGSRAFENTSERDGKRYYVYDNTEYEVIGVFKERNDPLDRAVYLNLTYLDQTIDQRFGVYYIDAKSTSAVRKVEEQIRSDARGAFTIFEIEYQSPLSHEMGRMDFTLYLFSSIAAFLCMLITTIFLISGQRYSLAVKKLCGMTQKELFFDSSRKNLLISGLSFLLLFASMKVLTHAVHLRILTECPLRFQHYLFTAVILFFIGILNSAYTTRLCHHMELSTILKGR